MHRPRRASSGRSGDPSEHHADNEAGGASMDEDDEDDDVMFVPGAADEADEDGDGDGDGNQRRTTRPRRGAPVSYKEKGILEGITQRRSFSPPPPQPLKVGDAVEVEVDEGKPAGIVWKPAVVQKLLRQGRFEVCVDGDESFREQYGPEDEGSEWRRVAKYEGLKRQRKSVEHYQPEARRSPAGAAAATSLRARWGRSATARTRRAAAAAAAAGAPAAQQFRRAERARVGSESSTLSSEGEFEGRKRRSRRA